MYANAQIYKLQHDDGHFYIGSTYKNLTGRHGRLEHHRGHSKEHPTQRVYQHISGEWNKVKIVLIEAYPCENKQQLLEKENEYVRKELENPLCLNYLRPVRSDEERIEYKKQHYEENKEHFKEYKRNWYLKNRERILEKQRLNYSSHTQPTSLTEAEE